MQYAYRYLDQTKESHIGFLTRLAKSHDVLLSIKGGTLLFLVKDTGRSASSIAMLPRTVKRSSALNWNMTLAIRGAYNNVEATWHHIATGCVETVTVGTAGPIHRMRHRFSDAAEAQRAAQGKLQAIQLGKDTISINVEADPAIGFGTLIEVVGFHAGIDGTWSVLSVRHELTSLGFQPKI